MREPGSAPDPPPPPAPTPQAGHERQILALSLAAGFLPLAIALFLLWNQPYPRTTQWILSAAAVASWSFGALAVRNRVRHPLQTLSNLLAAIREGDYSIRARAAAGGDALGELLSELNALAEQLRHMRFGAVDATTLLGKVMAEIELAVFTFDADQRLRLINRAGERLLAQPAQRALGRLASELGLADCLRGEPSRTVELAVPGAFGRWGMRRSSFRESGAPHQLLVLTDLSRTLREEERQAWQRLLRVLGHELNNSLAPIKSIAGSMATLAARDQPPPDWKDDLQRGLEVIHARADALSRFMEAYARIARLPPPRPRPVPIPALIRRVAELETRLPIHIDPGNEVTLQGDSDQLEQLLINLVRNAADAALQSAHSEPEPHTPAVSIGWKRMPTHVDVWIRDNGEGLANTSNLFVPFFTTKPGGSGIGLVLCRQIAEAHGGSLRLSNRADTRGCEARLRLPLSFDAAPLSDTQST